MTYWFLVVADSICFQIDEFHALCRSFCTVPRLLIRRKNGSAVETRSSTLPAAACKYGNRHVCAPQFISWNIKKNRIGYVLKSADVGTLFSGRNSENSSHTCMRTPVQIYAHLRTIVHTQVHPRTPVHTWAHPHTSHTYPLIPLT